ncbi:MAG: hypothetical protein ABJB11_23430 [Ferruginibacter sp.]
MYNNFLNRLDWGYFLTHIAAKNHSKNIRPSIHQLYNITTDIDTATQEVKNIYWQKNMAKAEAAKKIRCLFFKEKFEDTDEH